MRLIPIHPDNLEKAWKDVEKYVIEGIEYTDGKYKAEDIKALVRTTHLILWVVYNDDRNCAQGCLLTEVVDYPQLRCCSIFLLSGENFSELVLALPDLSEYAKGLGCKRIEFYGRSGWERVLDKFDFHKIHTVMRLHL